MLPLFEARGGQPWLRPVVERTYPMEQLAEAHGVMERNENFGKLVGEWAGRSEGDRSALKGLRPD
jgi:hypothetical protein